MSETPDLDQMARNYLDLWQEHLRTISQDGETMDVLARTVALMNSGAAAFATGAKGYTPDNETPSAQPASTDVARPETTGPAHESASLELAQCIERIAVLEKRVAGLERAQPKKPKQKKRTAKKS